MRSFAKVNSTGLVRDNNSGAILNTNSAELERYKQERAKHLENLNLKKEVQELKSEISEIKSLLVEVLSGKNNV